MLLLPALLFLFAPDPASEIRSVLDRQVAAWNKGDISGFMEGYERSDEVRFVSARGVRTGYDEALRGYRSRYASKEQMGNLSFSDLKIEMLGDGYASVIGSWHLARTSGGGGDTGGWYTLLFRKRAGAWKIILDHTS